MSFEITEGQVRSYVDDGYLLVEDLLSLEEVEEIRADAVKFVRSEYPTLNSMTLPENATDEQALETVLAVHFPHWVSPVAKKYIAHPSLASVVCAIAGAHLAHWDQTAKGIQSMLFMKPPGKPGQAWHQDERFIPTRDRSLVGAWIALDDATKANGCMRVLPGSHRRGYMWPTRDHGRPEEFDFADESHGFDESKEVVVEVKTGSVLFFNGYLLHRSLRNASSRFRRALVNHYVSGNTLLPWNTMGESVSSLSVGTYDNRTVVPLGKDPYADRGYTDPPEAVFLRPYSG